MATPLEPVDSVATLALQRFSLVRIYGRSWRSLALRQPAKIPTTKEDNR
jgi:hypothetical protein